MDRSIKQLIKERDSCYFKYQSQGRRVEDLHIVTSLTDKINKQMSNNRKSYFLNLSNQLNDKCLNPKKYWTLLRSFYNGRKVPLIPPILKGNKYVSDFNPTKVGGCGGATSTPTFFEDAYLSNA